MQEPVPTPNQQVVRPSLVQLTHIIYGLHAFAIVTGLICGQATWALNYWNVSNWSAGVLLLALFYLLVGLAQQHFQDRISPMILVEFAVVLAVALFAVWQLAPVR